MGSWQGLVLLALEGLFFNTVSATIVESQITNTFHSSVAFNGDSSKLIDNQGLDGNYDG